MPLQDVFYRFPLLSSDTPQEYILQYISMWILHQEILLNIHISSLHLFATAANRLNMHVELLIHQSSHPAFWKEKV